MKKLLAVLLTTSIGLITLSTFSDNFPILKQSGNQLFDVDGNIYVLEGEYLYPGEDGVMKKKKCSDAIYMSDPNIIPDLESYPVGSFPGKECTIKKTGEKKSVPLFHDSKTKKGSSVSLSPNLKTDKSKYNNSFACNQFAVYAPPLTWGPPISVASHIGPSVFNLSVRWDASVPVQNGVRYWTTSNVWRTDYFGASMRIHTGNAAASVYTFFKSHSTGVAGTLKVC